MLASKYLRSIWLLAALLPCVAVADPASEHEFELVLLATANMANGATLFDTCAACHGAAGEGASDGSVPAIGAQHFKVIARQLVDFRHGKRWDERMTHFANSHHLKDAQDIADVAAYINSLSIPRAARIGQEKFNAEGAEAYGGLCASCHGRDGEGSGALAIPRLAGQHAEYLLKQMLDVVEGRRPDYSSAHLVLFNRLHQAQFASVADYLAHIEPPLP